MTEQMTMRQLIERMANDIDARSATQMDFTADLIAEKLSGRNNFDNLAVVYLLLTDAINSAPEDIRELTALAMAVAKGLTLNKK